MKEHTCEPCPYPFGVLNVSAAIETYKILRYGEKNIDHQLHHWLGRNYVDESLRQLQSEEPLGRRIRSVKDLAMIVGALNRARTIRQKIVGAASVRKMRELYFYGLEPSREAAAAAGDIVPIIMDPSPAAKAQQEKFFDNGNGNEKNEKRSMDLLE